MEPLPFPPLPTQQEVIAENQKIRHLFFLAPPLLITALIGAAILIAICMALNFNPMNWLE
ncbi:MAG: hypothetical protein ACOYK6_05295 [Chthoniobacterales bacterium]